MLLLMRLMFVVYIEPSDNRVDIIPTPSIVNAIILSVNAPDCVIRTLSRLLLETLLRSEHQTISQFLSMIFQRQSSIFSEVSSDILRKIETEGDREALREIIRSIGNVSHILF
jgi:hypothetical protein